MSIPLQIELDVRPLRERLEQLRERLVPSLRRQLTRRLAREVLRHAIQFNPVDTARSRSAWVAILEQLAPAAAPADWKGPHPNPAAIAEGTALGRLQQIESRTTSEIRATNAVPYVPFLEYGTSRTRAHRMARRALQAALQQLQQQNR